MSDPNPEHFTDTERLIFELKAQKAVRQHRREQAFWANLPIVFIMGGIAAIIGGLYFALPMYQRTPDHRGWWVLLVFTAPGLVMILLGLINGVWRLIRRDLRKRK